MNQVTGIVEYCDFGVSDTDYKNPYLYDSLITK